MTMNVPAAARNLPRPGLLIAVVLFALASATGVRAQVWNEVGDAGDLIGTAQSTVGLGPLATINGSLGSANDVDLYCIKIPNVPPAGALLVGLQCVMMQGPNVWLFDASGNGVFATSTCVAGNKAILATSTSLAPGTYYAAVGYNGMEPNSSGGAIWMPGSLPQRTPDGPGGAFPLSSWVGTGSVQPINPYTITLQYVAYCDASTPAAGQTWGSLKIRYGS
jgi:hypothetical protein